MRAQLPIGRTTCNATLSVMRPERNALLLWSRPDDRKTTRPHPVRVPPVSPKVYRMVWLLHLLRMRNRSEKSHATFCSRGRIFVINYSTPDSTRFRLMDGPTAGYFANCFQRKSLSFRNSRRLIHTLIKHVKCAYSEQCGWRLVGKIELVVTPSLDGTEQTCLQV